MATTQDAKALAYDMLKIMYRSFEGGDGEMGVNEALAVVTGTDALDKMRVTAARKLAEENAHADEYYAFMLEHLDNVTRVAHQYIRVQGEATRKAVKDGKRKLVAAAKDGPMRAPAVTTTVATDAMRAEGHSACRHNVRPLDEAKMKKIMSGLQEKYLGELVPMPHQVAALEFFLENALYEGDPDDPRTNRRISGCIYGDAAGAGKTAGALCAATHHVVNGFGKVLIVVDKSSLAAWEDDLGKLHAIRVTVIHDRRKLPSQKEIDDADILVVTISFVVAEFERVFPTLVPGKHNGAKRAREPEPIESSAFWGWWLKNMQSDADSEFNTTALAIVDESDKIINDLSLGTYNATESRYMYATLQMEVLSKMLQYMRRIILMTGTSFYGNALPKKIINHIHFARVTGLTATDMYGSTASVSHDKMAEKFDSVLPQFLRQFCLRRLQEDVCKELGMQTQKMHLHRVVVQPTQSDHDAIKLFEQMAARAVEENKMEKEQGTKKHKGNSEQVLFIKLFGMLQQAAFNPQLFKAVHKVRAEHRKKESPDSVVERALGAIVEASLEFRRLSTMETLVIELLEHITRNLGESAVVMVKYRWQLKRVAGLLSAHFDSDTCDCPIFMDDDRKMSKVHINTCKRVRVFMMTAEHTPEERKKIIKEFNSFEGRAIFVTSGDIGVRAISLPKASHILNMMDDLNPARSVQGQNRIMRIRAQCERREHLHVYELHIASTVSEWIATMIKNPKVEQTQRFIGHDPVAARMERLMEAMDKATRETIATRFGLAVIDFAAGRKPAQLAKEQWAELFKTAGVPLEPSPVLDELLNYDSSLGDSTASAASAGSKRGADDEDNDVRVARKRMADFDPLAASSGSAASALDGYDDDIALDYDSATEL